MNCFPNQPKRRLTMRPKETVPGNQPGICIIVVNWNGGDDTVECLETLTRLDYQNYQIVVCDNQSADSSIEKIQQWANGQHVPEFAKESITNHLLDRARPPRITTATLDRSKAEEGSDPTLVDPRLLLVRTGGNLGFAGANNVGIRYAMNSRRFDYIWLVNNDTVVEADSLITMLTRVQDHPRPSICGSKVLHYYKPDLIQALGGSSYNHWTGVASQSLGRDMDDTEVINHRDYEDRLSYIAAVSCLVPTSFIKEVGLMSERYFLYYEEVDWSLRSEGKYDLVYAEDSRIYHKEGASIGSASSERPSSLLSEFYSFRNKLKIIQTFNPVAIPIAYGYSLLQVCNRIRCRQWDKASLIMKILLGKKRWQECDST